MAAAGALSLLRCGAGLAVAATLRAGRASRAACASVERVVLLARELAVVVLVELAEARVELHRVLRLVARDEAVAVLVQAVEARGVSARPRAGRCRARRIGAGLPAAGRGIRTAPAAPRLP